MIIITKDRALSSLKHTIRSLKGFIHSHITFSLMNDESHSIYSTSKVTGENVGAIQREKAATPASATANPQDSNAAVYKNHHP